MRRCTLFLIGLFLVIALGAPLIAAPAAPAAREMTDEQKALVQDLLMLREVWLRKISLQFISDKRSKAFYEKAVAGFSPELRRNFEANIKGQYRLEFFANYDAKADEVGKQAYDKLAEQAQNDAVVMAVLQQSPFPLDLSLAPLVKKLQTRRTFQAKQTTDQKLAAAYQKLADHWKEVAATMKANEGKDRYPALQEMYAKDGPAGFPIHWYDDAQHDVAFETEGGNPAAPKPGSRKAWTILAYVCADNDLERFGLQDINEMEQVGSSDKVNIVVQVDRMRGGQGDTITDGNWTGTRRYYVTRDANPKKISSKMVMNLKETDMGNKRTLADFLSWGVETYPADNVVVVIWNHGMGWMGVASDEDSGKYMRVTDVGWALREAQKTLTRVNKKPSKFAIVDFDACLMGTIEVAYELADVADFLVASEETEPGTGMPYAEYLGPLVKNPALSPREFTKRMVGTYVYSYAKGGSATNPVIQGSPVTKSAVDLNRVGDLVKAVDKLGRALLTHHDDYIDLLVDASSAFAGMRRYSDDSLVDLVDFAEKLLRIEELPKAIREACQQIVKGIGYPVQNERLSRPVLITSDQPGAVLWGFNGWRMPPKDLWPAGTRVFQSRLALTPLRKTRDGGFGVQIGPFQPVVDEALQKKVFVDEINYRVITADGKTGDTRRVRQGKEYLIVSKFPAASPLVIEGHTQGMGDSRGLSIYQPPAYKFTTSYQALKFAKDTQWDEFLAKIPEFRRTADVLLVGQMVTDPMTIPYVAKALNDNKIKFQVLWDPAVFGYQFKKILARFAKDGCVITDSVGASSMGQNSPSSDDLIDYLDRGGSLAIAAQSFEQSNIHRDLLQKYLRFGYVDDEKEFGALSCKTKKGDTLTFTLNGDDSANTAGEVTVMKTSAPGRLFVTLEDGRGAGIAVSGENGSGKGYRAVFLGFRFEAVSGDETRARLMNEVLNVIHPNKDQLSLFD